MMYRVYLVQPGGWIEFGIDYFDRAVAARAADSYRSSFPHRKYIVRRVKG